MNEKYHRRCAEGRKSIYNVSGQQNLSIQIE